MGQDVPGDSFREEVNKCQLVSVLLSGGTRLALEMPHMEKLLAELWLVRGTDTADVIITL